MRDGSGPGGAYAKCGENQRGTGKVSSTKTSMWRSPSGFHWGSVVYTLRDINLALSLQIVDVNP